MYNRAFEVWKFGNLAKTVLYFLRADKYSLCEAVITRKPVDLSGGDRIQGPCKLKSAGRSEFANILKKMSKS